MNVDAGSLFNESTFLVELRSLLPLLHVLADSCDFDDDVLFVDVLGDAEASLDIAHLDGSPGDAAIALCIMLLNIDLLIF